MSVLKSFTFQLQRWQPLEGFIRASQEQWRCLAKKWCCFWGVVSGLDGFCWWSMRILRVLVDWVFYTSFEERKIVQGRVMGKLEPIGH